jgi:ribonuclease HI
MDTTPRRNWRAVDWEAFNEHLSSLLTHNPPLPLASVDEFQQAARFLTKAITDTIEHCVPHSKPCPHSKRWWTYRLSQLRGQVKRLSRLSYELRGIPEHQCHDELKVLKKRYANEITETKKQHWIEWLEDLEGNDIWTANRYVSSSPNDGGQTRIPTLLKTQQDGSIIEATTNSEKSRLIAESFFPLPPLADLVPEDTIYPDPIAPHTPITKTHLLKAVSNLSGYKAPGPDGICNIVFKECISILSPYLLHLFNAVFTHRTYYEPWRHFTTVVLRKPGKPSYTTPKAYRPIALINTTCKLLTAIVADQLTYILEHHNLLPNTHFGGRPGRSTTDSLHLLENVIKNAWRSHKVASVLFLDIEGAFPNAVTKRLLHNMRSRRIPRAIVDFTEQVLTNRKTQLRFDGYTSDWIPINNGIGQGDPLSMILYIIYNSDLVDIANRPRGRQALRELTLAFVDDTALVAIAKDFSTTHGILKDMMERPGGGYDWSRLHNSRFETSKFALMDFSMNRTKPRPDLVLRGINIRSSTTHKFLGVILDHELRWKPQADYALAKGTAYVLQFKRLSSMTKGIPLHQMRQLYQAIAVPKMIYAASLWFSPAFTENSNVPQRGSIGIAKRMASIQRIATLAMTGAMRSTATDVLEAHTNILPTTLLLQNACHRAIIRIAAHPKSHPLYNPVRQAARYYVSHHRSSLHRLTRSFAIDPLLIETLIPARCAPSTKCPYKTHIADTREAAADEHLHLTDQIQVYSDGSGANGKIGAAAILFRAGAQPRVLKYHLGTDKEHTVYEAETVGLTLAAKLISTEPNLSFPLSISIDNQAALKSGENTYTTSGSYLGERFKRMMKKISHDHPNFDVTIRWVPGHEGIHGNEEADKAAKSASEGRQNNSPPELLPRYLRGGTLPLSISALKQEHYQRSLSRWKQIWQTSPRFERMHRLDPSLLDRSFIKLTSTFPKRLTGILIGLRTGHIALNKHLHRLGKSPSMYCPHCPQTVETVHHYLLACPQYRAERHNLSIALGRQATSPQYLLTNVEATPHLIRFLNNTKRLAPIFGEVSISKPKTNE